MNVSLLIIDCISNLQVGSGKDNDGLIDNLIQRDPVTGFPCIFSSSLKGALREHCEEWNRTHGNKQVPMDKIFGSQIADDEKIFSSTFKSSVPPKSLSSLREWLLVGITEWNQNNPSDTINVNELLDSNNRVKMRTSPGQYRFLDAMLVAFPIPESSNGKPYSLVTSNSIYNEIGNHDIVFPQELSITPVENDRFAHYVSDDCLPVIARNYLNNGISRNLWYEQVLPRKSRLLSFVMHEGPFDENMKDALETSLVQIGANATVGYGLCSINIYPTERVIAL